MTFLELCQRMAREADIPGTGPASVQNQSGELLRVVNWVAGSYRNICDAHEVWRFLRSDFSFDSVANQEAYLPTEITDTRVGAKIGSATVGAFTRWLPDSVFMFLKSAGAATQQNFWPITYEHFRQTYQLQPPAASQPAFFTVRPHDYAIALGPKPNDVFTISGEYYRAAPRLVVDDDTPLFPERYHLAIVWRALQKYAGFESDGGLYTHAQNEYDLVYGDLEIHELPRLGVGQPLV